MLIEHVAQSRVHSECLKETSGNDRAADYAGRAARLNVELYRTSKGSNA